MSAGLVLMLAGNWFHFEMKCMNSSDVYLQIKIRKVFGYSMEHRLIEIAMIPGFSDKRDPFVFITNLFIFFYNFEYIRF